MSLGCSGGTVVSYIYILGGQQWDREEERCKSIQVFIVNVKGMPTWVCFSVAGARHSASCRALGEFLSLSATAGDPGSAVSPAWGLGRSSGGGGASLKNLNTVLDLEVVLKEGSRLAATVEVDAVQYQ